MHKDNRNILSLIVMISQVTFTMLTPIAICTFLGYVIGEHTGAKWISVIGFFVGCIAGFRSVYLILKRYLENE